MWLVMTMLCYGRCFCHGCYGNCHDNTVIVWQRFCEPCQTKNCILSVCPSVRLCVHACVCVLYDISRLQGCNQWPVHLYIIWAYALVVPPGIYFFLTCPSQFWGGASQNLVQCLWRPMVLLCICICCHVIKLPWLICFQQLLLHRFYGWQPYLPALKAGIWAKLKGWTPNPFLFWQSFCEPC